MPANACQEYWVALRLFWWHSHVLAILDRTAHGTDRSRPRRVRIKSRRERKFKCGRATQRTASLADAARGVCDLRRIGSSDRSALEVSRGVVVAFESGMGVVAEVLQPMVAGW